MTTEEQHQEEQSYKLRTEIESKLSDLAELWGPDDTIEWVEGLVERMKEEAAELGDDGEGS